MLTSEHRGKILSDTPVEKRTPAAWPRGRQCEVVPGLPPRVGWQTEPCQYVTSCQREHGRVYAGQTLLNPQSRPHELPGRRTQGRSTCPELPRCLRPALPSPNEVTQYLQVCRKRGDCLPFAARRRTRLWKNTAHVVGLGLDATDTVQIVRHFPAP
jgi:hypothetical protein